MNDAAATYLYEQAKRAQAVLLTTKRGAFFANIVAKLVRSHQNQRAHMRSQGREIAQMRDRLADLERRVDIAERKGL